jgi:hypothetical protein
LQKRWDAEDKATEEKLDEELQEVVAPKIELIPQTQLQHNNNNASNVQRTRSGRLIRPKYAKETYALEKDDGDEDWMQRAV